MRWDKRGVIYCPDGSVDWMHNSVLTPQPFLLNAGVIRIFGSFRDSDGRGRIGYIDVDSSDPKRILAISREPVLDLGAKGMFDDNGVILGDVIRAGDKILMYYAGFQLVKNAKFLAFTGLAISSDNGNSFQRFSKAPIMDRCDNALLFRVIHSVIVEKNIFRIWYAVGSDWKAINGIPYPRYDIRYTESPDGLHFPDHVGKHCIGVGKNEYRIGRPKVKRNTSGKLTMRYTFDTLDKQYTAGYAESDNGYDWIRMDHVSRLEKSVSGWDSEMACYPVEIDAGEETYLFYNGNGMGQTGVGYARLVSSDCTKQDT